MKYYAIASLLDDSVSGANKDAWESIDHVRTACGIEAFGALHFSWHVSEGYDIDRLNPALMPIFTEITLAVNGLGIFTGDRPVLYLPVVKTVNLLNIHRAIWNNLLPLSKSPVEYYDPDQWVPHITLAYEETTPSQISRAVDGLIGHPIKMIFSVKNYALLFVDGEKNGVLQTFPWGGPR